MAEIGSRAGIEKQLDGLKKQKEIESKELSISEEDISKNAYRLNTASHNIMKKSDLLDR